MTKSGSARVLDKPCTAAHINSATDAGSRKVWLPAVGHSEMRCRALCSSQGMQLAEAMHRARTLGS